MTRETFLAEIEAFLKASGMTATAFGKEAVSDPNFVFDLRRGRRANLELVEKAQRLIAKHAPVEATRTGEAA